MSSSIAVSLARSNFERRLATMARASSVESTKSATKRKGGRSVSTLTPQQLARKRANDREAQRAIRARTKEHIERLERELEDLKSRHSRDQTVQELLRRNKVLEEELRMMRESIPMSNGHHYSTSRYEDHLSLTSSGLSSRASSYGQRSPEYAGTTDFSGQYLGTPEACDAWTGSVLPSSSPPPVSPTVVTNAPSDEYVPAYIPSSVPTTLVDASTTIVAQQLRPLDAVKTVKSNEVAMDTRYSQPTTSLSLPAPYMPAQQPWNMYPVYYTSTPSM